MPKPNNVNFDKEFFGVILSVAAFVGGIFSLITDLFQLSQSTGGKIIVYIILVVALFYIVRYYILSLFLDNRSKKAKLDEIRNLMNGFIASQDHKTVQEEINHDLVYRTVDTRHIIKNVIPIENVQLIPNGSDTTIEITIGCGYNQGLRQGMLYKIHYRFSMDCIHECSCTVNYDQSVFSFSIPPTCPVPIREITKDSLVINPVIDKNITAVNKLLADILYEID